MEKLCSKKSSYVIYLYGHKIKDNKVAMCVACMGGIKNGRKF